jgi:hypothetical protein
VIDVDDGLATEIGSEVPATTRATSLND